jgi:hypothetical protein
MPLTDGGISSNTGFAAFSSAPRNIAAAPRHRAFRREIRILIQW